MFKVKYYDEVYTVYSIRFDKKYEDTYFLIYRKGEWQWVDSFLYTPLEEE